ncbi:DNA mismatch repair protein [Enterococcus florum]|uniref:DNA mismatch repair protein n=1 Tax=Enterococcus florum TaxID=2480627 RepID=A0A4P5P9R6_9ENTE|nr:hypothetical protein [Enterococcus florum]GCF93074.1 DNA mismatch repair protein [Enterococcus florum]
MIVYAVILGIVSVFFIGYSYLLYQHNQKVKARIAAEYGKAPVWSSDERDYASMRRYYQCDPLKEPQIDDITWQDLDMDLVFQRVKNTQSSIGDEYCYRLFRQQHNSDSAYFEAAVQAMQQNAELRQTLQFAFHRIGRKTGNGLIELLLKPTEFPKIPIILITLMTLSNVAALIWLRLDPDYGILATTLGFAASLILFSIVLRKIYASMVTLGMFTRMVRAAKQIIKEDPPAFKRETDCLKANLSVFKNISALADYIIQVSGSNSSLMIIITCYFGLYGFAYFAVVRMLCKHRQQALELYRCIGFVELCISTASYRDSLVYYCQPEFHEEEQLIFEEIVHPLLKKPVPNSCTLGNKLLITGSNASGKSTFARTLAVNTILGQLLNTCLAKQYRFRPCEVYSSMNLKDDLTAGDSFYVAEVKSVKRLLEVAAGSGYPMIFLDELFKGTNVVERIAAASVILKRFASEDCFLYLATHDMELSRILHDCYDNYHFQEVVTAEDILFDYVLKTGATTGSNAIKLLAHCEYDPELVRQAEACADAYRKTGEWGKSNV